jgi:hypothetical protein
MKKKLSESRNGILGHQRDEDSSLLLHDVHSPLYWRILQKPSSTLVLKIHKKLGETKK